MIRSSLIISTYNFPRGLNLCFLSILNQSVLPGEIIVADDGSGEETIRLVESYKNKCPVPLIHVWHEDLGFRKTIIQNKAVKQSTGDYIIQIDGDIIISKDFIKEHMEAAKEGYFIRGSRTLITEKKTNEIFKTGDFNLNVFTAGLQNRLNALHYPLLSKLYESMNDEKDVTNVIGCNTSFWRSDFIKVNGFNNDLLGWGREDGEFAARLVNSGVLKLTLKFKAICFHLHHTKSTRASDERNTKIMLDVIAKKIEFAANGYLQV